MTELGEILRYAFSLVVLIAASAFFSGTEVALFGLRRVDREQLVRSVSNVSSILSNQDNIVLYQQDHMNTRYFLGSSLDK